MQKKFVLLSVLIINICNAAEELREIKAQDISCVSKITNPSLDTSLASDPEFNNDESAIMEEYDLNITDSATPPTISNVEIIFRNIMGSLLLRYIQLREKTNCYLETMKNNCKRLYRNAHSYFSKCIHIS